VADAGDVGPHDTEDVLEVLGLDLDFAGHGELLRRNGGAGGGQPRKEEGKAMAKAHSLEIKS